MNFIEVLAMNDPSHSDTTNPDSYATLDFGPIP